MIKTIRPQEGFQMDFLSSPADIVIGGGAAGVGKTFALLLEPLRNKEVEGFGSVCFRRTSPQIKAEGALWDTSLQIYTKVNAKAKESSLEWDFGKSKLKFSHLEYEKNIYDWQGSQVPLIMFDELTHFSKKMFFYMLTRNRSTCGVNPYIRATCNPDPESWVADFISWWIDEDTGFIIPEREGVLRYLVIDGDSYIWGSTVDEVIEKADYLLKDVVEKSGINPKEFVKSVTFIAGNIYQNKELLKVNPAYLGNLLAQDEATKKALLDGNWKVVISENDIFDYYKFMDVFENSFELEQHKHRYITADIALKGNDKFIVGVWHGFKLVDLLIMDKSNGKEVVDSIKHLANKHKVPNSNIVFDNDGLGGFVDGFIVGAKEFKNGGKPFAHPDKKRDGEENYFNLKTQCYYAMGDLCDKGEVQISEEVAFMMYDEKMTVRQRFFHERKAIKRDKTDDDGKLMIVSKKKMKAILQGESPDIMDMFMMRAYFIYNTPRNVNNDAINNIF